MNRPALHIRQLVVRYGNRRAIDAIDLQVEPGEWLAVVGANGSGKSTLLDAISGRRAISGGTIAVDGHPLDGDLTSAKSRLGYAVAADALPGVLSGRQCLAVHAQAKGVDIDTGILALADALRLGARLDEPVSLYSYGTRQKLGLLLALLGEPALLLLDESFNGLDAASSIAVKRHLRERADAGRCAIVLATHALDIVERCCDRALRLDEGRIAGEWNRDALRALRHGSGLEAAMAGLPAQ